MTGDLPCSRDEHLFRFPVCDLRFRSDSMWPLRHMLSMYGRFSRDSAPPACGAPLFEVRERLKESGEMQILDPGHLYRLESNGGPGRFTCRRRRSGEFEYDGVCDAETLLQSSILTTVAEAGDDWNLFHAGVVRLGEAGIVLAGGSETGKTTLTLELVRKGCGFLSDEIACIEPDSMLLQPFPRKLNLRPASRELLGLDLGEADVVSVDIEQLYPGTLSGPCRPAHLFLLRGIADEPHLAPISRTHLLFRLFRHAVGDLPDRAGLVFRYIPMLQQLRCHELVAGSPGETADRILKAVA